MRDAATDAPLPVLRDRIEELASETGAYYLVCGRHGDRPVPAADCRFDSRSVARRAARLTEQYRRALREYDPEVPHYDIVVCQTRGSRPPESEPADGLSVDGLATDRSPLVEFCHRTAAAVFETLAAGEYDGVEAAVMDTYFEAAETGWRLDHLCRCLLETMATELAARLSVEEQATVLSEAASRLDTANAAEGAEADAPVEATFDYLREHGVLADYARSPLAIDLDDEARSAVVRLSEYALSPRDGRLPTLPITVALARHHPGWLPVGVRGDDGAGDDEWVVELSPSRPAAGVASVPIDPGVS